MMPVAEITESDNDSFLDVTQALDGKEFIMNAILHVHPNTFRVGEVGQKNCSKAQSFRAILVPVAGLEPARCRHRWILSPLRLPIPSHRHIRTVL